MAGVCLFPVYVLVEDSEVRCFCPGGGGHASFRRNKILSNF